MWRDAEDGLEIERVPTGPELLRRFKYPYVVIHRVDLHRVLLNACGAMPSIELTPSTTVSGFEDLGDRVRALTDRGPIEARRSSARADYARASARAAEANRT